MSEAKQGATMRWQMSVASGIAEHKKSPASSRDIDLLGIKAEQAVAKLLSIDYTAARMGIDDGVDIWFGDIGIDVKATFHQSGKLLFKSLDAFRADVAIFVTSTDEDNVMFVVGGIGRASFAEMHQVVDLGYGPCCTMDQDKLWPIGEMWSRLCEWRYR